MAVGGAKTRYFLLFLDLNPLSTRPGSCAAETTALGPTGTHLGGLPGGGAPAPGALNQVRKFRAIPKAPRSARPKTQRHRPPEIFASGCRATKNKK